MRRSSVYPCCVRSAGGTSEGPDEQALSSRSMKLGVGSVLELDRALFTHSDSQSQEDIQRRYPDTSIILMYPISLPLFLN